MISDRMPRVSDVYRAPGAPYEQYQPNLTYIRNNPNLVYIGNRREYQVYVRPQLELCIPTRPGRSTSGQAEGGCYRPLKENALAAAAAAAAACCDVYTVCCLSHSVLIQAIIIVPLLFLLIGGCRHGKSQRIDDMKSYAGRIFPACSREEDDKDSDLHLHTYPTNSQLLRS